MHLPKPCSGFQATQYPRHFQNILDMATPRLPHQVPTPLQLVAWFEERAQPRRRGSTLLRRRGYHGCTSLPSTIRDPCLTYQHPRLLSPSFAPPSTGPTTNIAQTLLPYAGHYNYEAPPTRYHPWPRTASHTYHGQGRGFCLGFKQTLSICVQPYD